MSTELTNSSKHVGLVAKVASRYSIEPEKFASIIKRTAFRTKDREPSNEELVALLAVAERYGLDVWTKQIHAFVDKSGGIVPVVGVDGWNHLEQTHPQFAGERVEMPPREEWIQIDEDAKLCPPWITVTIKRSDHGEQSVTEYLDECYKPAYQGSGRDGKYKIKGPWQTHTKRMLRHKARIQAIREVLSYGGIYDEDEAERIVEASYDVEGSAVEVEPLGEESWQKLVMEAERLGYREDEVIASAATAGYEGPPEEMPRELAERLFRAMLSTSKAGQPRSAAQQAADGHADAKTAPESSEASDAATGPSEADSDDVADEEFLAATDRDAKDAPSADNATKAQLNLIAAVIKKAGLPEAEWRGYMKSVTGKTSRSDLTKAEASAFIDFLSESGGGAKEKP